MGAAGCHLFVDVPALSDGLLGQGVQAFGLGRVGVRERAVAQLAARVVGQRDARPRRVEQERVAARCTQHRVVPDQRPVPAGHGAGLLVEPTSHLDAVGDAVAVGDHQRWPVVGLRLAEGAQCLLGIRPHGHPRDVHVAVGDGLQGDVLLGGGLACGSKLGDRPQRRCLGRLTAGVGVDLGVEHQHVHVAPARQDMVQPAGPDVVGPAVAADDPHAAPDQVVHHAEQVGHGGAVQPGQPPLELGHPSALGAQLGLAQLAGRQDVVHDIVADHCAQLAEPSTCQVALPVGGEPKAQPELGVVLEQGVRPGRAAALRVRRPRRGGQVPAVDR